MVLERHTYAHRAEQLRGALADWAARPRFDISIWVYSRKSAAFGGDLYFGRALQRALRRAGHTSHLRLTDEWDADDGCLADVAVHLFGRDAPLPRPGQVSAAWIISHPEALTDDRLAAYDAVFVASDPLAADLAGRLAVPVIALHQATDVDRFRPVPGGPRHDLLFVANSRGSHRRIVDELTPTTLDLAVYGRAWSADLLDPAYLKGEHVPNAELAAYYAAATIVLADHWPEMAARGFMSNRLYDASASGSFVISDAVPGIEAEFDGGIPTFTTGEELRALVGQFLQDAEARADHARRARQATLARHTFEQRTNELLATLLPMLGRRGLRIGSPTDGASDEDAPTAQPPA